jgi:azurin
MQHLSIEYLSKGTGMKRNRPLALATRLLVVPATSLLTLLPFSPAARADKTARATEAHAQQAVQLAVSTKGNELSFVPDTLTAHAGQAVSLVFKNSADSASGLKHNWVLVKPGAKDKVVSASLQAGQQKNYVPDSPDVIAHTALLNPGESATVQFTVPQAPGDYPFFCSFPGHSELLKGTLHVEP